MASSIVPSSFTHVRPATSGAGTALGAAAAVGDVIVVFSGDGGGVTATAACTGATCTLASQKQQIGNDGLVVTTVFTGTVTGAGTPTIAVTSAGGNLRWDGLIISGLSSATAHAVTGGTFPADAGVYSASVTTTVTCTLLNYWADNSLDPFVSWLLSATELSSDAVAAWSGSAYLLDQVGGTYAMGMNSTGSGSNRLSMITLALPTDLGINNRIFYIRA